MCIKTIYCLNCCYLFGFDKTRDFCEIDIEMTSPNIHVHAHIQ